MSIVATKKLLFLLADDQDRCYFVQSGIVKKRSLPIWLEQNPNGWKDITLQFATNQKYFSTLRSFSNAVKFVEDGQTIIADRMLNGAGTEEVMYLIILKQDSTMGLNGYRLEYKSRLDFSKFNGDIRTGIAMNTLQDDVFSMVQANENAVYSIQCNSSNPAAIKVLFDGTLLQDKYNYQGLDFDCPTTYPDSAYAIPVFFTNNEGDSFGIVSNSPSFTPFTNVLTYLNYPSNNDYVIETQRDIVITIKGEIVITQKNNTSVLADIRIGKNNDTSATFNARPTMYRATLTAGRYVVPVNYTIPLLAGEKLFILFTQADFDKTPLKINWKGTSLGILMASKSDPSIAYAIRPLDLLKQLVSQITNGKYTADSQFLASNNRKVVLSGSALRNFPDAVVQTTFSDFFQAYTVPYNLGVTVRNGVLYVEPVETIYNNNRQLLNLGQVSQASLTVADEFIYTSARVGYVKQTYNKRNGRYEYNCTHNYKFPIHTVLNQFNLVSPYRADSFGMEFIRTGYPDLTTTDDKGDADVFYTMISDTVGQADGEVSTAISVTVETLIVATPIIKTPYSNTIVYNQNPTITGIAQPFKIITVYVDSLIDGTTSVDAAGNWTYQIQTPLQSLSPLFSGVHSIVTTAETNPTNVSGFSRVLTLTVNTQITSAFIITSPTNNDTLYNNLPIISGIAPSGKVVSILLDGNPITTVTANSSGLWSFQATGAIADGSHVISATTAGLPNTPPITVNVNKNVSSPLITSLAYGDIIFNNLPLIKGVAIPGTTVPVYLDGGGGAIVGGIAGPMGTALANASGDWTFQVVTVTDASGNVTNYIPDGQHIVSTTPTPVNVVATITGYRLMRGSNKGPVMDYDTIKLDDQYIPTNIDPTGLPPTLGQFLHPESLYNIEETTPLRLLRAHDNVLGFLKQQAGQQIAFNGAEVNANLVTKKNGVIFNEGAGVDTNALKPSLFHYFYLNFKAKVPLTFNQIMTSVNNDGYITTECNGIPVYCLPIGQMNMKPATDEAQQYKLLVSSKTPLASLLQLFSNGLSIKLGRNMIYISDKNPIHFVRYNYTPPVGFHFADIYDNWQKNRFPRWIMQPDYSQPFQRTDPLPLQVITNGVSVAQVFMISVSTGKVINVFPFAPVAGSLVQLPNILQQCSINLSPYPDGQYWFALFCDGAIVGISEKIWLKQDWPDTMAFDYGGSKDKVDYYFSTGIAPRVRVQSEWLTWVPGSEVDNFEDEGGDWEMTRAIALNTRTLVLGSDKSLLADWMARKMNVITLLSNCLIEGVHHTRNNDSKLEKEDFGPGIPEGMYKMEMVLAENENGVTFGTPGSANINNVPYVLDALAFGQNAGVIKVTAQ